MGGYLESAEELMDDMAAAIKILRTWAMEVAEQHEDMDTSALDDLLRRHRALKENDPS